MRAIAILLVVSYHVGIPGLGGGYIGVDVFFVVSGYLITELLLREAETTGAISLAGFYARRARRLLPALSVVLLVTIAAASIAYSPAEQCNLAGTAITAATYSGNIFFARLATDYLAGNANENPLLHTWSLSVEEQFYLVWPLFVMLALGLLGWQKRASRARLVRWMIVLLGSFALSCYLTRVWQPGAFFLSPPRAWEFALGALAVLIPAGSVSAWLARLGFPARAGQAAATAATWVGLGGIVATAILIDANTAFPGLVVLVPVVSTALVLRGAGARSRAAASSTGGVLGLLGLRPFQELGRLSYSWYLWHWPVLVLSQVVAGTLAPGVRAGLAVMALVPAELCYRLVENPIRQSRRLAQARPAYSLALAAALTCVTAVVAYVWMQAATAAAGSPQQARYIAARHDLPILYEGQRCDPPAHTGAVIECEFGAAGAQDAMVLFGDSHAGQWFPALDAIARERNWRLIVLTQSSCPVLDVPVLLYKVPQENTECAQWRQAALERIGALHPRLVVASTYTGYLSARSSGPLDAGEWVEGTARVLAVLAAASERVMLLRDTPYPSFDVPACLARRAVWPAFLPWKPCDFSTEVEQSAQAFAWQRQAAARYANVAAVDLTAAICPGATCDPERDGMILYRDAHHLSATFAESLTPVLAGEVDLALAQR